MGTSFELGQIEADGAKDWWFESKWANLWRSEQDYGVRTVVVVVFVVVVV